MQSNLNLQEIIGPIRESLEEPDDMLGKGLMMPFNDTNSGGRKLLYGTQREHVIPINNAEVAFIQCGYEDQFGEYSSSIKRAKGNYKLLAKIPKFRNIPDHHYYAIFLNEDTNILEVEERKCYKHITESYGYTINNTDLDKLKQNEEIPKGKILQRSNCFDDYNNRKDGLNLLTMYNSCAGTMEDGIILSKSAQKKIISPLVHYVSIVANDNDIPLNLFGDDNNYKIMPDILQEVPNGILTGLRRENNDEMLFSQTFNRLKDIMMSDDKYTVQGRVVDINVYCNNPDNIMNNAYYSQVKYYYEEDQAFSKSVVDLIIPLANTFKLSYDLQKLYHNCREKLNGIQYIKDRPFSNVVIDLVLIEQNMVGIGDKLSDRYGGKGVVVNILDDEEMPRLSNGMIVEVIFNKSTCINRLNAGQLFETEINHVAQRILEFIETGTLSTDECIDLYIRFLKKCNPPQAEYMEDYLYSLSCGDKEMFVDDLLANNGIYQSLRPISDSFTLDKLNDLYKEFSWVQPYEVEVPMTDSVGNKIYRKAIRPIICGTKYIYRLKQYAREKFSVCSLSATNIRNENSRSKANKMYKGLYTKTPIKFGEMESGNKGHMGMEFVIINLLLYSASPHARRMAGEQLLTGDPFNIDVKLDTDCRNSGVQALNTLLKAIGLRLVFEKVKKQYTNPILTIPIIHPVDPDIGLINPIRKINKNQYIDPDLGEKLYYLDYDEEGLCKPIKEIAIIKNPNKREEYLFPLPPEKRVDEK